MTKPVRQPDALLLGYARKSRIDPHDRKTEESTDRQAERLTAWATEQDRTIELYMEPDGKRSGGSTLHRPAYQNLIERIQSALPGEIAGVILTDVDRAGRLEADLHALFDLILERGLSLRVLDNPQFDIESTDGRFMAGLQVLLAARERRKTSDRLKVWAKYRQEHGAFVGREPYGYRWHHSTDDAGHKTTHLAPHATEVERLTAIYVRYSTTDASPFELAEWANAQGWRTKGGGRFQRTTIDDLTARVMHYRGFLLRYPEGQRPGRVPDRITPAQHPAVITAELAAAVDATRQRRLGQKRGGQRPRIVYVLKGLIHCAICGSPVYCTHETRRATICAYYKCGRRYGTCTASIVRCDVVERQVWQRVSAFAARINDPSVLFDLPHTHPAAAAAVTTSTIAAIEGEQHRLNTLFVKGRIAEEAYERDYARLAQRLTVARTALATSSDIPIDMAAVRDLLRGFDTAMRAASPEAARIVATALLASVTLRDGTIEAIRFVPALERVRQALGEEPAE